MNWLIASSGFSVASTALFTEGSESVPASWPTRSGNKGEMRLEVLKFSTKSAKAVSASLSGSPSKVPFCKM